VHMTKAFKELVVVLLAGAGIMFTIWGAFATGLDGIRVISQPEWPAIFTGIGLLLAAAALALLVKTKRA